MANTSVPGQADHSEESHNQSMLLAWKRFYRFTDIDELEVKLVSTLKPVLNTQGLKSSFAFGAAILYKNLKIENGHVVQFAEE